MFDTAKEFYQAAYFTSAAGALLSLPSSQDQTDGIGLLLMNGGLAVVTFLDYRAWRSLPAGLSGRIRGLGEFETFSVFLAFVSALYFTGLATLPTARANQYFRSAIAVFGVHTFCIVVYWLWLCFADRSGRYKIFSEMATTTEWSRFSTSPVKATILTTALYLGTTIIASILVWRPSFGPFGGNGYWNVASWLAVMCAFYGVLGPVRGFTKIVAIVPLGVVLVAFVCFRASIVLLTRP